VFVLLGLVRLFFGKPGGDGVFGRRGFFGCSRVVVIRPVMIAKLYTVSMSQNIT
jgi:hypothetical protein